MKNEIKNNVVHLFIGAVVGAGIYLCWYYSRFIFPVILLPERLRHGAYMLLSQVVSYNQPSIK